MKNKRIIILRVTLLFLISSLTMRADTDTSLYSYLQSGLKEIQSLYKRAHEYIITQAKTKEVLALQKLRHAIEENTNHFDKCPAAFGSKLEQNLDKYSSQSISKIAGLLTISYNEAASLARLYSSLTLPDPSTPNYEETLPVYLQHTKLVSDYTRQIKCIEQLAKKYILPFSIITKPLLGTEASSIRYERYGTSLHIAARAGNTDVVDELIDYGTDVDSRDYMDATPLHWAVQAGNCNMVKKLIDKGADINTEDDEGYGMPLHWAATFGKLEVLKELIAAGADIHARNQYGRTALHQAGREGHQTVVKELLDRGAEVDAKDFFYWTPLHLAAHYEKLDAAKELITRGADVNAKTFWDWTPLYLAAREGKLDMVKELIAYSANTSIESKLGNIALDAAKEYEQFFGDSGIVTYLESLARKNE